MEFSFTFYQSNYVSLVPTDSPTEPICHARSLILFDIKAKQFDSQWPNSENSQ